MITVDHGSTSTITVRPIVLATFLFEQAVASILFLKKKRQKDVSYLFFQSTRNDSQIQKLTRMLLAIGRYFMIYS